MPAFYEYRHVELDRVGCGKRKCGWICLPRRCLLKRFFCLYFSRVLKPPGGGSSDIFGTSSSDLDSKPATTKKYTSHFPIGSDLDEEVARKGSSIDSNDGASTPSQTSTSNGSPNNSEPNTPRSGKQTLSFGLS